MAQTPAYEIQIAPLAFEEIRAIDVYERNRIIDEIDRQLPHQPTVQTRNRKPLLGVEAAFHHATPLWQLRVGDWRVFYDVDEGKRMVSVRAVRRKDANQRTEDILK
jgi:mRNA-degrading endonuclease RelE of RelBE toxin-antitoxin system